MSSIKYRNSANDTWQELQVIVGPQGPAGATGATGPAGATGATGPQGPAGANGADGNGIASIVLNNDYTLTITYTDGTSTTTGSIRGPQGEQGPAGSGASLTAGDGIDITNDVISSTVKTPRIIYYDGIAWDSNQLSADDQAYLINLFNYGYENYPCIIMWSRQSFGVSARPFYYLQMAASNKIAFYGTVKPTNEYSNLSVCAFTISGTLANNNQHISAFTNPDDFSNCLIGCNGIRVPALYSPTGSAAGAGDIFYWLKQNLKTVATSGSYNDLTDKPTIPTVPTNVSSFTNDAGYLTAHQSLTGYATETYVNQAVAQVSGGTTYTAGTGISISNGVISLALANASQEEM